MALPLLASFLLYIFVPQWMRWSQVGLPLWVRILAAILGFGCLPFIWWVFTSIGKNISETVLTKKDHQLVTKGPYRWVRHPLYAGALTELLLLGLLASNWFMLALWALGVLAFRFIVIPKEEGNLIKVFGEAYREYQKRTGALIPRLWQ
jgi:protein-S-isoprenylcysteine O-methyltransferase Ste14